MLVRFASDRRNYQGGAKRNRRMQELPKIVLVFRYCLHPPMYGLSYPSGLEIPTGLEISTSLEIAGIDKVEIVCYTLLQKLEKGFARKEV